MVADVSLEGQSALPVSLVVVIPELFHAVPRFCRRQGPDCHLPDLALIGSGGFSSHEQGALVSFTLTFTPFLIFE